MSEKYFKVSAGIVTPAISFVNTSNSNLQVSYLESNSLSFSGSSGQLFSVVDSMSGAIFSVNDISGIPSIEVYDTGAIRLAETFGNVLIGTAVDNGYKVNITGNVYANSNVVISGTTTLLGNLKVNAGINANNSLGTAGQVLTSNGTIAYWSSPAYGAFQSVSNQFCAANTATAMLFEITDFAGGVSMTANSYIGLPNPGTYNLQFSVQTKNTGNAEDTLYIWLRQNNVDIVGSTGKVIVRGTQSGGSGESITGWNFFVRSTAPNENIRIMWFAADETHTHFAAFPAQSATGSTPAIPSTASTVLTVNQIG
jgi:hypothetical protein